MGYFISALSIVFFLVQSDSPYMCFQGLFLLGMLLLFGIASTMNILEKVSLFRVKP